MFLRGEANGQFLVDLKSQPISKFTDHKTLGISELEFISFIDIVHVSMWVESFGLVNRIISSLSIM